MYQVVLTDKAKEGAKKLSKNEPQAYKKLLKLITELENHPTIGTGQVEQLKGNLSGYWSRRITKRHRLIYRVTEEQIQVTVINTYDHDYTSE
ncbi:Txe/YoeB family addiction module toxin [uncultured Porphyromonas sp.]|jgi:addiction module toxin, txe/yoeB family|uniref:Txe/YoeB family addiction module toxin n=1 Tax=uncultured Porphyromonas sp. TaxID=159274 RepID=UPI002615018C|nr:Txe/YoeB family addiction module toxin [uncultured Porphyromonas sp.]